MASVGGLSQTYTAPSAAGSIYAQTQRTGTTSPNSKTDGSPSQAGALASAILQSLSQLGINTQALATPSSGGHPGGGSGGSATDSNSNSAQQALNQFMQGLIASMHNGFAPPASGNGSQSNPGANSHGSKVSGITPQNGSGNALNTVQNGSGNALSAVQNGTSNAPNSGGNPPNGAGSSNSSGLAAQIAQDLANVINAANANGNSGAPVTATVAQPGNGPVYTTSGTPASGGPQNRLQNLAQNLNAHLQAAIAKGPSGANGGRSNPTPLLASTASAPNGKLPPPAASTGATVTSSTGSSISGSSALPQAARSSSNNPASPTAANLQQSFQHMMQSLGAPNQTSLDGFLTSLSTHLQNTGNTGLGVSTTA